MSTARKPRVLLTHTYSPEARIAKWFRYCRNYAHETQKRPGMDAGARRTAPWTARFDGFVKQRYPIKHNSYSILAVQRSSSERVCTCLSRETKPRPTVSPLRQRGSSLRAFAQRLPPLDLFSTTAAMPASYFSQEVHRFSQRHNPASLTMLLRKSEQ